MVNQVWLSSVVRVLGHSPDGMILFQPTLAGEPKPSSGGKGFPRGGFLAGAASAENPADLAASR
jgi:hypothetical protein